MIKSYFINILFVFIAVISITDARIKFKKIDINADPNYLRIEYNVVERDNKPYLNAITEVLQDIDGEIIVRWIFFLFEFAPFMIDFNRFMEM